MEASVPSVDLSASQFNTVNPALLTGPDTNDLTIDGIANRIRLGQ